MLEQRPKRLGGVGPPNFLACLLGPRNVVNRDLGDSVTKPDGFRRGFRAKLEPLAGQPHPLQNVPTKCLVAGGFVCKFAKEQDANRPGQKLVDDLVGECHARWHALAKPRPVDHGLVTIQNGLNERGNLFRGVL